jgi:flagellar M-ring protein FliF
LNGFVETLRRLGPVRLGALGAVAIGFAAFFLFMASRLNQPDMGLLYSELSAQDSGQIVGKLEAQGIPYELRAGGSQIYVPSDRALRLRMSFAEEGLPRGGVIGYEIFDRSEALGATSFVQNLNQLRAIEGELARTISSLAPVAGARVHLVIPRRDLFSRERQEPTASVVVKLRQSGGLARPQVQAIQHIVASSVAGLKPERVSIVDDRGTLLARGQAENDSASVATTAEEMRRSYEQRAARTIEELLERSVGPGKVRAEVSAEMDFDRIVTSTESYDPDGQVVRSTQTVSEANNAEEATTEAPASVTANLPEGVDAAAQGRNASRSNRTEETVNYEISRTTKNHVRETGVVRRLSVAILVDGTTTTGADGTETYQPRPQEEIDRLAALAKSAVGFNAERGDTLELVNLPFVGAKPEPLEPEPFLGLGKYDYLRIVEFLWWGILAVLALLLGLRPLVSTILASLPPPPPADATPLLPGQTGPGPAALAAPSGAALPPGVIPGMPGQSQLEQMIDLKQVEGRVRASAIKKVGEIVENHPNEAVTIIRNWMYQEK